MSIQLSVDELWDCIYAARMQERYWKTRRRHLEEGVATDEHYSHSELCDKVWDAMNDHRHLESIAPEESF